MSRCPAKRLPLIRSLASRVARLAARGVLLTGSLLLPTGTRLHAQQVLVRAAPYAVDSVPIRIKRAPGTLEGTLLRPVGVKRPPLVLFVGDEGVDRDGNRLGQPGGSGGVRQLAESLAVRGFASVRYDRRGTGASRAAEIRPSEMRFDIPGWDAASWLLELRERRDLGPIFMAGIGEGGLQALVSRQTANADGYLLLGTPARTARQVLRPRFATSRERWRLVDSLLTALRDGRSPGTLPFSVLSAFPLEVHPYLTSWLRTDPLRLAALVNQPCLIVHGTVDRDVPAADADSLMSAQPGCMRTLVEGMAHPLTWADSTDDAQQAAWSERGRPLAPGLLERVLEFLQLLVEDAPDSCAPSDAAPVTPLRTPGGPPIGKPVRLSREGPAFYEGRYLGRFGSASIDKADSDSLGEIGVLPPGFALRYGAAAGKCGAVLLRSRADLAADTARLVAAAFTAYAEADTSAAAESLTLDVFDAATVPALQSPRVRAALQRLGVPLATADSIPRAEAAVRTTRPRVVITRLLADTITPGSFGRHFVSLRRTGGDAAGDMMAARTAVGATVSLGCVPADPDERIYQVQFAFGRWLARPWEPDGLPIPCAPPVAATSLLTPTRPR